jgi:glycogen synthase
MRILFVSTQYPPETGGGGIGSFVADVAPALVARGHDVHVLSCAAEQQTRDYYDRGVQIHRRGRMSIRGLHRALGFSASDYLSQALSAFVECRHLGIEFDVIEIPDWYAEGLFFSLWGRYPLVAHLHCATKLFREQSGLIMTRSHRLADYLERIAVHGAHVITSPSHHHIEVLLRTGWLRHRCLRVIPYPIQANQWYGTAPVEETSPVVLQVSRLEPLKSPQTLIQALGLLRGLSGLKAVFVGRPEASYQIEMETLATRLGVECEFIGYLSREELTCQYGRARLVVLPSRFESFGIAILEAMAASRPVVISDSVGAKELIDGSGAGVVVPTGDAEALARAMRPYLEDAGCAARAGREGRMLVERHVTTDKIAREREAVYREAVQAWQPRLLPQAKGLVLPFFPKLLH